MDEDWKITLALAENINIIPKAKKKMKNMNMTHYYQTLI